VAIFRSEATVVDSAGRDLGSGMLYLHLPRGLSREQQATGTVSLKTWEPTETLPTTIRLSDGRRLTVDLSRDALSDCSRNRILRFSAPWPPSETGADARPE
jgi:hypothetical protein